MGNKTNMHQSLHGDQLDDTSAMYGDPCCELQDTQLLQQDPQSDTDIADLATTPVKAVSLHGEDISTHGDGAMLPLSSSALVSVDTPVTAGLPEVVNYADVIEQTLRMLNEAALRVAAFNPTQKRHLRPSRLSRYCDISSEIQRQNTPFPPTIIETPNDLSKQLVAIWPWLEDEEEPERAKWHQHTDPLALRRWPALLSRLPVGQEHAARVTGPITFSSSDRRFVFARVAMFILILLTLVGLVVDGVLATMVLSPRHAAPVISGSPTLVLSENKASFGQIVHVHILHFAAVSSVLFTHDSNVSIKTNMGIGLIRLDQLGARDVTFAIDSTWSPGLHTLEAEDMANHYTAFATLQVVSGSVLSTHLNISSTSLNFSADMQGTNIIQMLTLYNNGSGPITWSAYSDQPWLRIAPIQGTFSAAQTVIVGVQRSNLPPHSYNATITISTNTGDSQQVQVTMAVQPLHANRGAILSMTPAVMALTAHARATDANTQYLVVSNPGSQNLYWSLENNLPVSIANQSPVPPVHWLDVDQTSGVVAPGMTRLIAVHAYSSQLLPGTYINDLLFNASPGHTIQDTPQHIEIALIVQ